MSEADYDPLSVGAYAEHLAKVNDSKQVLASSDIYNAAGAIIAKSGTPIDKATTQRLAKFKLQKPLEQSVKIDGGVSGSVLFSHITKVVNQDVTCKDIHAQYELDNELRWLCSYYQTFPQVRQMITVLALRMRRVYQQSLYSAWLVTLIGKRMGLPQKDLESLFLAALAHDVGMLHIDEKILNKKESLTPEEWRSIYAHPIIGEKVLSNVSGVSSATTMAIREHHEKCDGTGYPSGRFEKEISQQGHILALADTVVVVLDKMLGQGLSFRNIIPVIQINQQSYSAPVYSAFMTAVKKVEIADKTTLTELTIGPFIDGMLAKTKLLKAKLTIVEETIEDLGYTHENRKLHSLQTVYMQTKLSVHGAGVLDAGYESVLADVRHEADQLAYREVEDVGMMVDEIQFQIKRINRMIEEFAEFDQHLDAEAKKRFIHAAKAMSELDEKMQHVA